MPTNADHRTIADYVMRRRSNCRRRTKSTVVTVTVTVTVSILRTMLTKWTAVCE